MAPSQMENEICSPEYTHKKFNYGYSHKKLGMRLIRRGSQEELGHDSEMGSQCSPATSTLFRPYALKNEESPKKRKITSMTSHQQQISSLQSSTANHSASSESQPETCAYHYYTQHYSQQQSPDAYALKLQRQRAALYMRHVMQYYENGNGWPTVHPNAMTACNTHLA